MAEKFNYVELQNDADELIDYFGFSGTTAKLTKPTGVRANFYTKATGEQDYYTKCVVLPLNNGEKNIQMALGITSIEKMYKILISGKDLATYVDIGDTITAGSSSYKVLSLTVIKPYHQVVLYKCIVEII